MFRSNTWRQDEAKLAGKKALLETYEEIPGNRYEIEKLKLREQIRILRVRLGAKKGEPDE